MNYNIDKCKIINLPVISDARGNLSFIENENHLPFSFSRFYYLYDIPGGSDRGGHAHKDLHQLIIAGSGSFHVHLDDGSKSRSFILNSPNKGLYICPHIWRSLDSFSSGSLCMVLASDKYDESDYLRTYDDFLTFIKS